MRLRVVRPHQRSYEEAIAFRSGEAVCIVREDQEQPGWFWCIGPDGREGWVYAGEFLSGTQGCVQGRREFNAMELSVDSGDELLGVESVGGWWYCRAADGRMGWVPTSCLEDA